MGDPRCICDFDERCSGTGEVACRGCGGDLCVCRACLIRGCAECPGCVDCLGVDEAGSADREEAIDAW